MELFLSNMKRVFAIVSFSLLLFSVSSFADITFTSTELDTVETDGISVVKNDIHLSFFNWDSFTNTCSNTIALTNTSPDEISPLTLDASSDCLEILTITDETDAAVQFSHVDQLLELEYSIAPNDTITFQISYHLLDSQTTGPFGAMGFFKTDAGAFTFSFPDGVHAWFPTIDHPSQKAPVDIAITVPSDLNFSPVATGILTNTETNGDLTTYFWEEQYPVCTSEIGLCMYDYHVIEAAESPVPIRYYVYQNMINSATFDLERIPEAVEFLTNDAFDYPYPFEELKIAVCGVFGGGGGQEHQTLVSLGHSMITGNRTYESIVVHEIAHQWFADLLTPTNWDHFWLNEGMAVYSEALWAEHLDGWEGYMSEIRSDQRRYLNWEHNNPQALINDDYFDTMNSPLPYQRGALVYHQLRARYGFETVRSILSTYLAENAYGNVVTETIEDVAIRVADDESLADWFEEWVWRGEVPLIYWAKDENGFYFRQILDEYDSPSHGLIYDNFNMYVGIDGDENTASFPWPSESETLTVPMDVVNSSMIPFPNLEVPARLLEIEETTPILKSNISVRDTDYPKPILSQNESATLVFSLENLGTPMTTPQWEIIGLDASDFELLERSGTLATIEFLHDKTDVLELSLQYTGEDQTPQTHTFELRVFDESNSFSFVGKVMTGSPEVLLISAGIPGVADSLGAVFGDIDIPWGFTNEAISALPEDMYGTSIVMVEADGTDSGDLFTENDLPLRNWFRDGNGGSISGLNLSNLYTNAPAGWASVLAGTWNGNYNSRVIIGIEGDLVSEGVAMVNDHPEGTSGCEPCCNNPPLVIDPVESVSVGGKIDLGWRIISLGFSLSYISNNEQYQTTRTDFVRRIAGWMLDKDLSSTEPLSKELVPDNFSLSAYPNPFNASTHLQFSLPTEGKTKIEVFNIIGQRVAIILNDTLASGSHSIHWDSKELSTGSYFVVFSHPDYNTTQKITLLK